MKTIESSSLRSPASLPSGGRINTLWILGFIVAILASTPATSVGGLMTFESLGIAESSAIPSVSGISFENLIYVLPGNPRRSFNGNSQGGPGGIDNAGTGAFIAVPDADGSIGIIRSDTPLSNISLSILDIDHQITSIGQFEFATIRLFNDPTAGSEIAAFTLFHDNPLAGDGIAAPVSVPNISDVYRIEINGYVNVLATGAGFGIDNFGFTSVPEPSTITLGLLCIAIGMIRRRQNPIVH